MFIFRYTASEALDILLNDMEEFTDATITMLPPSNGQESDEDSGDEEGTEFHQLSRNQLLAEAELEIDYGSHIESSIFNNNQLEVVNEPRRSSRLNSSESTLDLSADLWADESSTYSAELDTLTPAHKSTENHWLSKQLPPLPPTAWFKGDIMSNRFRIHRKKFRMNVTRPSLHLIYFLTILLLIILWI